MTSAKSMHNNYGINTGKNLRKNRASIISEDSTKEFWFRFKKCSQAAQSIHSRRLGAGFLLKE